MASSNNWKIGVILSLTTAFMWAFLPVSLVPLLKVLDPYTITFYRLSGGGLLMFIWLVATHHQPSKIKPSARLFTLLTLAILCLCANYFTWLKGLDLTTPATAQVVIQIAPMLLILGSVVIFKEPFSFAQLIGVLVFVVGLLLFFNQRLAGLLDEMTVYNLGLLYVFVASVLWAIYALAQKELLKDFQALELIFIIVAIGSLLFLPFASPAKIVDLSSLELSMLAFGAINTAVAYGCFTQAMHYWETSRVSALVAVVPVLTLIITYIQQALFPNYMEMESINSLSIAGAVIVVVGSAITALSKSNVKSKTDAAYLDCD